MSIGLRLRNRALDKVYVVPGIWKDLNNTQSLFPVARDALLSSNSSCQYMQGHLRWRSVAPILISTVGENSKAFLSFLRSGGFVGMSEICEDSTWHAVGALLILTNVRGSVTQCHVGH